MRPEVSLPMTSRVRSKPALAFASTLCLLVAACPDKDEDRSIDIRGLDPEQAAAEYAGVYCDYFRDCGQVSISCEAGPAGNECEGTIEPIDYAACLLETQADARAKLECADLTPAEEEVVHVCLNWHLDRPCLTQAEVDARVAALERGEDIADASPPEECAQMEAFFEPCDATPAS
jgi:hypothetical protein